MRSTLEDFWAAIGGKIAKFWASKLLFITLLGLASAVVAQSPRIQLVVDYSGSMHGEALTAAENSASTLLDLADIWRKLYPNELKGLQLDYIGFGGESQHELLYQGTLNDNSEFAKAAQALAKPDKFYSSTDYHSGLGKALEVRPSPSTSTLVLTDAQDEGPGPRPNIDYSPLRGTRFLIFGKPRKLANESSWLTAIPASSEQYVGNSFDYVATLVTTLFSYVDDLNNYIVQRGQLNANNQQVVSLHKHAASQTLTAVISSPGANATVTSIRSPDGTTLPASLYRVDHTPTFVQIVLPQGVAKGEYKIQFNGAKANFSADYISFLRAYLNVRVTRPHDGACFADNATNALEVAFIDSLTNMPLNQRDFLNNVAFRIFVAKANDVLLDSTFTDGAKLAVPVRVAPGSIGSYKFLSDWSYDPAALERASTASLIPNGQVCVAAVDALANIRYDTSQAWQGRRLTYVVKLPKNAPPSLAQQTTLNLETGEANGPITLELGNEGEYSGTSLPLQAGALTLSLENPPGYQLAFDNKSIVSHTVKPRRLITTVSHPAQAEAPQSSSWWSQVVLAWNKVLRSDAPERATVERTVNSNSTVSFYLPYEDEYTATVSIRARPNKLFPDERFSPRMTHSNVHTYTASAISKAGWRSYTTGNYSDSAAVRIAAKDATEEGSFGADFSIKKIEGQIDFNDPLEPMPTLTVGGSIVGNSEAIILDDSDVKLALRTDPVDRFVVESALAGMLILLIIVVLAVVVALLIFYLTKRRALNQRRQLWNSISRKSPEDFLEEFPAPVQNYCLAFAKTSYGNGALYPYADQEPEVIRARRAMRTMIREDDAKLTSLVVGNCKKDFLTDLEQKVSRELPGRRTFQFYTASESAEATVKICGITPDSFPGHEDQVRTRVTVGDNFGTFTVGATTVKLVQLGMPSYIMNGMTPQFVKLGEEIPLGQTIHVGPGVGNDYFAALFERDGRLIRVHITVPHLAGREAS